MPNLTSDIQMIIKYKLMDGKKSEKICMVSPGNIEVEQEEMKGWLK